jgi:hypothetical protein
MRNDPYGPEPTTAGGAPLLTHNHVILLQALLDRPRATATSYKQWVRTAMPYARMLRAFPSETSVRRGIRTLNEAWATRHRHGRKIAVTLTARGHAILELRVAAHVRGYGPYRGLATLRRPRAAGSD